MNQVDKSLIDNDYEDIILGEGNANDSTLLFPIGKADLGTKPDINTGKIHIRIGRSPQIWNLRELYKISNTTLPKELQLFDQYNIWVIAITVQIMKEGGFKDIRQLGCKITYPENRAITILSGMPETSFIKMANGSLESSFDLGVNGSTTISEDFQEEIKPWVSLDGGLKIRQNAKAQINLSFSVITPTVIAIGAGDYAGEWLLFRNDGTPLVGQQPLMHILLCPKDMKTLKFEAQVYATIDTLHMLPMRLTGPSVEFKTLLDRNANVAL